MYSNNGLLLLNIWVPSFTAPFVKARTHGFSMEKKFQIHVTVIAVYYLSEFDKDRETSIFNYYSAKQIVVFLVYRRTMWIVGRSLKKDDFVVILLFVRIIQNNILSESISAKLNFMLNSK